MSLDATVTVGDLLTMIAGGFTLLGIIIFAVGSRWFPSKKEVAELREHGDAQVTSTRQDVQNAVSKLELVVAQHGARLERVVTDCTAEARSASLAAGEARYLADKAAMVASNNEKSLDSAVTRLERLVEGLLNRDRGPERFPAS